MATTTIRTPSEGGSAGAKRAVPATKPVAQPTVDPNPDVTGIFGDLAGGGDSKKAKAAALRGVDIEKRRIDFQLKTGLRDIEQAREEGLRGAINNALQRGIYRSGIRIENEAKVNRESDEATSDLKTDIGFALELLKNRADQIKAGGGGGGVSGFGFDFGEFNEMLNLIASFGLAPQPTAPTVTPRGPSNSRGTALPRGYGGGQ